TMVKVSKFLEFIADDDVAVRFAVYAALTRFEEQSWKEVRSIALDESAPEAKRLSAIYLLTRYQNSHNQELLASLRQLLSQPDKKIRWAVIDGLHGAYQYGQPQTSPLTKSLLVEICKTMEASDDSRVIRSCCLHIWYLGQDGAKAIPSLMKVKD